MSTGGFEQAELSPCICDCQYWPPICQPGSIVLIHLSWSKLVAQPYTKQISDACYVARENVFYHLKNDNGESSNTEFAALPREEAIHKKIPVAFVGTQSPKNPNWDKDPEHQDKSTIFVATGVPYNWFKEFEGTKLLHRGDE